MQTIVALWQAVQFVQDHWGAICSFLFGVSEVLGMFGKGGIIPATFQAIFKKGAQKELTPDEAQAKLEQESALKNK